MKRVYAFSFLLIVLCSFTPFREVLKFPMLIVHYNEHKSDNSEMTVLDFIVLHYFSGNVIDADYEKDMKLPFKTIDSLFSFNGIIVNPHSSGLYFLYNTSTKTKQNFPKNIIDIKSSYLSTIWQPPRFS